MKHIFDVQELNKVQVNLIHEFLKYRKETSYQDIKVLTVGLIDFGSSVKTLYILTYEMVKDEVMLERLNDLSVDDIIHDI